MREYLIRVEKGEPVHDFFGSWFNIQGKKQTGYFLGHEIIRALEGTYSLREIALWSPEVVRQQMTRGLRGAES